MCLFCFMWLKTLMVISDQAHIQPPIGIKVLAVGLPSPRIHILIWGLHGEHKVDKLSDVVQL